MGGALSENMEQAKKERCHTGVGGGAPGFDQDLRKNLCDNSHLLYSSDKGVASKRYKVGTLVDCPGDKGGI